MRIAVLADVHGNLPALEAVLADLKNSAPDLVVNLGDHLSGPLWAAATADLLMDQKGWIHIRGNHDRQLLEVAPEKMGRSDSAATSQLVAAHLGWLRSLPATMNVEESVYVCHGTPAADTDYLIEDVSPGFPRLAESVELRSRAGALTGVILCGHSHVPRFVSLGDGTILANPGSVGLQAYSDEGHLFPHVIEVGSPHARYMVLDRRGSEWEATTRVLAYDWDSAAHLAEEGDRPEWALALRTGRVRL